MAAFNIKRLASLPGVLEVNTMYIVRHPSAPNLVNLTFVGSEISEVRHVFGEADTDLAIKAAIAALTPADIPAIPGDKITTAVANATAAVTAEEAAKLTTARNINGVAFDGTADITVHAEDTVTPRLKETDLGVTVASLVDGKIPMSQIPNGLDNIETFPNALAFPMPGDDTILYIASDNNQMYRWSSDVGYILISAGGGTSDVAVRLATARAIALAGDVTGTVNFDGSQNVTIESTLRALTAADIPALDGAKITTGKVPAAVTADTATTATTATTAAAAAKLETARTIILSGDVGGSASFDGSGDITITTTSNTPVTGYTGLGIKTTFANGLAQSVEDLVAGDIPALDGAKITTGKVPAAVVADTATVATTATIATSLDIGTPEW